MMPCGLCGDGNSITSPRTNSHQRLSFSGLLAQSANCSAVMGRGTAVGTVLMASSRAGLHGRALRPSLLAQATAGQGQRAVDHNLLAEGGGDDVVTAGKRLEDALAHQPPEGLEQN